MTADERPRMNERAARVATARCPQCPPHPRRAEGPMGVRRWRWLGVLLLLGLLLAQMGFSSVRKSATFDEAYHLGAGYAYLRTGEPRLNWEHPPLIDTLAALPLLLRSDVVLPLDRPTWERADIVNFSDFFVWEANFDRAPALIVAGRWPVMGLAVLLGLVLFLALRRFVGEPAAWLGLTLFALDPNIVGNGRVIMTDLGVSCFLFIAVWRLAIYLNRPSASNLVLAGLAAGLTLCAKFSGVLVGPVFLLIGLFYRSPDRRQLPLAGRAAALAGMGLVALVCVWAAYGFGIGPVAEAGFPLPSPTYWRGMAAVYRRVQASTPTFFLGQIYETGPWYYFPAIFILKTPLPTLILLGLGLFRLRGRWRRAVLWWAPVVVVFVTTLGSPLKMSYRYILPALPFAIALGAAGGMEAAAAAHAVGRTGPVLLVVWAAVGAISIYPHHLSFVNELGGGPENAHRLFSDADWGQDLVGLREYLDAEGLSDVRLSYFGSADPAAYGLHFRPLPAFRRVLSGPDFFSYNPYTPDPGTYAISTTSLQLGLLYQGRDLYAVFRDREPNARVGYSMRIYEVAYPPAVPVDRAVVVGPPVWDLPPETLGLQWTHGWAQDQYPPGRRLIAKWTGPDAFVLAAAGPARYLVEQAEPGVGPLSARASLVEALLAGGVSTAAGDPVSANPLEAKVADARPLLEGLPAGGADLRERAPTTPGGDPVSLPAFFDGGPALAGYEFVGTAASPDQAEPRRPSVDLVTYWRVGADVDAAPSAVGSGLVHPVDVPPSLAVFVHVLDSTGTILAQWDGWPVALGGLEAGDVVVLYHPLVLPEDAPPGPHAVQVGLYLAPDGPRLPVAGADRLLLPSVEVIE